MTIAKSKSRCQSYILCSLLLFSYFLTKWRQNRFSKNVDKLSILDHMPSYLHSSFTRSSEPPKFATANNPAKLVVPKLLTVYWVIYTFHLVLAILVSRNAIVLFLKQENFVSALMTLFRYLKIQIHFVIT